MAWWQFPIRLRLDRPPLPPVFGRAQPATADASAATSSSSTQPDQTVASTGARVPTTCRDDTVIDLTLNDSQSISQSNIESLIQSQSIPSQSIPSQSIQSHLIQSQSIQLQPITQSSLLNSEPPPLSSVSQLSSLSDDLVVLRRCATCDLPIDDRQFDSHRTVCVGPGKIFDARIAFHLEPSAQVPPYRLASQHSLQITGVRAWTHFDLFVRSPRWLESAAISIFSCVGVAGRLPLLVGGLRAVPCLEALELVDVGLTHAGLQSLANSIASLRQLRHLNLSHNALKLHGARTLASIVDYLLPFNSLQSLFINGVKLENGGLRLLARHLPKLHYLGLADNKLSQVELFQPLLHAPDRLRYVDVSHNPLGDVGAALLLRALAGSAHWLRLNGCGVSAASCFDVVADVRHRGNLSLRVLHAGANPFSREGLSKFWSFVVALLASDGRFVLAVNDSGNGIDWHQEFIGSLQQLVASKTLGAAAKRIVVDAPGSPLQSKLDRLLRVSSVDADMPDQLHRVAPIFAAAALLNADTSHSPLTYCLAASSSDHGAPSVSDSGAPLPAVVDVSVAEDGAPSVTQLPVTKIAEHLRQVKKSPPPPPPPPPPPQDHENYLPPYPLLKLPSPASPPQLPSDDQSPADDDDDDDDNDDDGDDQAVADNDDEDADDSHDDAVVVSTSSESETTGNEADVFEVEKIIDCGDSPIDPTRKLYLVRWKGFGSEEDTWEPIEHLQSCLPLVENFERLRSLSEIGRRKSLSRRTSDGRR